jgi:hypothetical protein
LSVGLPASEMRFTAEKNGRSSLYDARDADLSREVRNAHSVLPTVDPIQKRANRFKISLGNLGKFCRLSCGRDQILLLLRAGR